MILSAAVIVSVLSLFSSACALTVNVREDDCAFACPKTDAVGNALSNSSIDDKTVSCSYTGEPTISCVYDAITGLVIGDNGDCPEQAVERCSTRRTRQFKQAVVRRAADDKPSEKWGPTPSPNPTRERRSSPSPHPKRAAPSPTYTSEKRPHSQYSPRPKRSPSPSSSRNPSPQLPTQQPCNYKCPTEDLAKSPLTDEEIRDSSLYCSYSSKCKYSTKTGLLLEDNDEGNCPQSAAPARPWDGRSV